MSFNVEMNKWAPKLTIVFQLTIWSIIGLILLQKGTISLYEKGKSRNNSYSTQEKLTKWNEKELIAKSNIIESLPQIDKSQISTQQENIAIGKSGNFPSGKMWPLKLQGSYRSENMNRKRFDTILKFKKETTNRHTDMVRDTRSVQTSAFYATNKNLMEANSTPAALVTLSEKKLLRHEHNEIPHRSAETNKKNEKKLRRSPVNRIGAAVAIIMLAIGIVMLLLGPLIVIVRAISNRRRTTKMLKSRCCVSDHPPSYEEATLMDQAPRYSTLQLDTNLDTLLSP